MSETESLIAQRRRRAQKIGHRHDVAQTFISLILFAGQRLLFGAFVLLVIVYLSYLGLDMAGGTPFSAAATWAARQTVAYIGQLARGDLGLSIAGSYTYAPVLVAEVVPGLLAKSLGLLFISLTFAIVVGGLLGIWAAKHRHTGWSLVTLLVSVTGISVPSFFAVLLLQLAMIQWTRTFGRALLPVGGFGWDERVILPALVLAARPVAQIARVTFVAVGGILDQDFVRTARSKGLPARQVMNRHVLINAAIPMLTTMGVSLRYSLGSLPVVEFFFSWTGMGFTLLKAISLRDDNLTVLLLLCLGTLMILVNVLLEVAYRLIDPRLREVASREEQRERERLSDILRSILADGWDWVTHFALWRRLRAKPADESPFHAILEQRGIQGDVDAPLYKAERRRSWIRGTAKNVPFVLGSFIVLLLVVVVLFGPRLAPYSPYTTRGLEYKDGKLTVPPFAPGEAYPWGTDPLGRDVMSLVLSGAQQTMLLVALVASARMALGLVLGVLAGWLSESWIDRLLLRLAEIVASFPALLLAMTLILALGIRAGMKPFVVALSLIGWVEIMQFVRGQVMTLRSKPFIESAMATGLRTPRLILNHVLPNLFSSLVSIAALEMGAVLMILGELGFVGIFIGGGAFAELQVAAPPYHYSDVPEWGALLSNIRLYARAYPWMALYPATAFFVAILGFNFFGEGIRRMVESVGIGFSRLVNRYTLAAAVLAALGLGWARQNTGAMAFYRQHASTFDAEHALAYVEALSEPALKGRSLGTPELTLTAERIADQFQELGLQPGGQNMGYFQERSRSCEIVDAMPNLSLEGQGDSWAYRHDYVEYPGYPRNRGAFTGPVQAVALGKAISSQSVGSNVPQVFEGLGVEGEVVLALSDWEALYLRNLGAAGLLVVTENETELKRRYTLSDAQVRYTWGASRYGNDYAPMLWITEAVANRLLEGTGYTVASLRHCQETLRQSEFLSLNTGARVSMEVPGALQSKIPVRHVIGHMPGYSNSRYGGINNQVIVVLAQYDNPPLTPDGTFYAGANDNASGVALMMELVRTMREADYQPYRTFIFIAYSGEGLEGGGLVSPSVVSKFLQAKPGFTSLKVEAIVHLRGVGAGDGDALTFFATGSRRLSNLFAESARRMRVRADPLLESVDISIVFEEKSHWEQGQEAPELLVSWEGWESISRTEADTVENLSTEKLGQAGRALTLALMVMGRELEY